ncbi:hypothetical protein DESC_190040 [Desulfosarcina cetonica]|nr:hypothetical protein DESC_190040 [Desulfosarcina cetonica]
MNSPYLGISGKVTMLFPLHFCDFNAQYLRNQAFGFLF